MENPEFMMEDLGRWFLLKLGGRHIRVIFEEFGKIVLVFKTKLKSNLFNAFFFVL